MAGPLAGLRVVECGTWISAPFCARLLADLGADVTKVEPPVGDPTRGVGAMFPYLNAGKGGWTADLDEPEAREHLHELLGGADVLVENVEPDARRRWGLDFPTVESRHPRLVAVSI